MKRPLLSIAFLALLFSYSFSALGQITYTWNGGANGSWANAANWSPARNSISSNDILVFGSGSSIIATNVPSQTIGSMVVSGGTFLDLQSSSVVSLNTPNVRVDNGSSVTFSSNGATGGPYINVNVSLMAEVRGTVTMNYGTFAMQGSSTMVLQGASPLNRVRGQFSLTSTSTIQFGTGIMTPQVILPNNIFSSSPTVANMVVNNGNGVSLGNQNIIVDGSLTLTSGSIISNSNGRMIFTENATFPAESESANIDGFVELRLYPVGTGGLSFMGLNISPGPDDIGQVSVVRRTGSLGIAAFNGAESIASTWEITAQNQPVSGRDISFSWVSVNDNATLVDTRFQVYRYENGPSWEGVGELNLLSSNVNGVRTTAAVTTTHFSDWTVADESNPLPVTWEDFYGLPEGNSISLVWKTASEKNADYFTVEKLKGDKQYFTISEPIKAAGNSLTIKEYGFVDTEPSMGANYYRLKQVDYDGMYDYSKTIVVHFDNDQALYSVYPNPASTFVRVRRNVESQENEKVDLVDSFGRVVYSQTWADGNILSMDNIELPAGFYRLIVKGKNGFYMQKVILD